MKDIKSDNRSKYTQTVIKNALLKMMIEKPLNKITVNELCEAAQIHRGTFYNHYYDIYNVYERIQNELLVEVKERLDNVKAYAFDRPFFKEILLLIYRNYDICRVIIEKDPNNTFLPSCIEYVREKFISEWTQMINHSSVSNLNYIFSYTTHGAIGMISDWVKKGMIEPLDDIVDLIEIANKVIFAAAKNWNSSNK